LIKFIDFFIKKLKEIIKEIPFGHSIISHLRLPLQIMSARALFVVILVVLASDLLSPTLSINFQNMKVNKKTSRSPNCEQNHRGATLSKKLVGSDPIFDRRNPPEKNTACITILSTADCCKVDSTDLGKTFCRGGYTRGGRASANSAHGQLFRDIFHQEIDDDECRDCLVIAGWSIDGDGDVGTHSYTFNDFRSRWNHRDSFYKEESNDNDNNIMNSGVFNWLCNALDERGFHCNCNALS